MDDTAVSCPLSSDELPRRAALKMAVGIAVGLTVGRRALADEVDPKNLRPQVGDQFVFADGDKQGLVVAPADLAPGGPRVMAFPMDPKTSVVRDGSRLNKVVLVHLDPGQLAFDTRPRSVEGIVAYSAVCTHQGCDVWEWQVETKTFWCPCHGSRFDPSDGGRVVEGPAPKRLAALPLTLTDGMLTAAGKFSGPVGAVTR